MEAHLYLSDQNFANQFKNCTLDPSLFNHEAHLRLAWISINKYGLNKAIDNICTQLVNFVTHVGAADKYNKTLTIAAVKAVHHFIERSKSDNFQDFLLEFPRLKNHFKDLMAAHYSIDIFNSPIAKQDFLEPDLLPFS